jgi:hypothetical protein
VHIDPRYITRNAYFSLLGILGHIGHREPTRRLKNVPAVKYSHIAGFRQISDHWLNRLDEFLKGNSTKFLEDAVTALLEKPRARRCAEEVQEWINDLKYFYKFETSALRKALHENNLRDQFVPQEERDQLFIKTREKRNSRILNAEVARRLPSQRF